VDHTTFFVDLFLYMLDFSAERTGNPI